MTVLRAIWCRLARFWGWQRSEKPKPRAKRLPRGWYRHPPPFDPTWSKGHRWASVLADAGVAEAH